MPHLEFVVPGPPLSSQTKDRVALKAWQASIRAEAVKSWTATPLTGKLKFTVFNFHEGEKPSLDDDNMVKPIRDALNKVVYLDDSQIRHSVTYHCSIDAPMQIRGASSILLAAFSKGVEFVYIRIEDAPTVLQLPG